MQSYSALGVDCDRPVSQNPMGEEAAEGQMRKQKIISDGKATLSNIARVPGRRAAREVSCAGVVLGDRVSEGRGSLWRQGASRRNSTMFQGVRSKSVRTSLGLIIRIIGAREVVGKENHSM